MPDVGRTQPTILPGMRVGILAFRVIAGRINYYSSRRVVVGVAVVAVVADVAVVAVVAVAVRVRLLLLLTTSRGRRAFPIRGTSSSASSLKVIH